jgi:plastocyanin
MKSIKTIVLTLGIMIGTNYMVAGTLTGTVNFEGKAPKKKTLKMDADPQCGSANSSPVYKQSFIIDEKNNLANVLVYLNNIKYSGETPKDPAVIDQKGCVYYPHVMGIMKGQEFLIKNSDPTLHNIHGMPKVNNEFNFAMPKVVKEKTIKLEKSENAFKIKCDVHPWMNAYIQVFDHPYFAVTDGNGTFKIENIPSGEYEVIAWQEKFKDKTLSATVKIGDDTTSQNFTFKRPSKKK